jgi:DNA-binding NtrC family response regulator
MKQFIITLRELEKVAHVRPVVMMMTTLAAGQRLTDFGNEIQALIQKPFDVTEVAELVQDCVAVRRLYDRRKRNGLDSDTTRLAIDKRTPRISPPDAREH